jgi:hypothetical protein
VRGEVLAARADRHGDGDDGGDPGVAFVEVEDGEAAKGDAQSQNGGDDDADGDAETAVVDDGGEAETADDGHDDTEAGEGGEVEQDGERDEVAAVFLKK